MRKGKQVAGEIMMLLVELSCVVVLSLKTFSPPSTPPSPTCNTKHLTLHNLDSLLICVACHVKTFSIDLAWLSLVIRPGLWLHSF